MWTGVFLSVVVNAFGFQLESIDVGGGVFFQGKYEEPSAQTSSAVNPIMINYVGIAFPFRINPVLYFPPSLSITGTHFLHTGSRAVPAAIEDPNTLWVLHMIVDVPLGFSFQFNPELSLSVEAGVAFFLRFPLWAYDQGEAVRLSMYEYLFGNARFLYPETGIIFTWKFAESFAIQFRGKVFYPLFHAWDGENLPFYDQLIWTAGVGLQVFIQEKN